MEIVGHPNSVKKIVVKNCQKTKNESSQKSLFHIIKKSDEE